MSGNTFPTRESPGATQGRHESLLVLVAEDPQVSNLVRAILGRRGYSVLLAEPARVMALLRGSEPFTGILVTNSPASFLEFADAIRLLYLSSAPDPRLRALFPSCRVVRKPFAPEELVQAVEELEGL